MTFGHPIYTPHVTGTLGFTEKKTTQGRGRYHMAPERTLGEANNSSSGVFGVLGVEQAQLSSAGLTQAFRFFANCFLPRLYFAHSGHSANGVCPLRWTVTF